jgi:hypothetical protein
MIEAARTSETSVDIDSTTQQYIPEDSELHTRRRENLKSHIPLLVFNCNLFHRLSISFQAIRLPILTFLSFGNVIPYYRKYLLALRTLSRNAARKSANYSPHFTRKSLRGDVGSGAVRGESVLVGGLKGCYWWKTV